MLSYQDNEMWASIYLPNTTKDVTLAADDYRGNKHDAANTRRFAGHRMG